MMQEIAEQWVSTVNNDLQNLDDVHRLIFNSLLAKQYIGTHNSKHLTTKANKR